MPDLYYKAVPAMHMTASKNPTFGSWTGIKTGGLVPSAAGGFGGATSMEQAGSGRQPTAKDKNLTWLGSEEAAKDYAGSVFANRSPVLLRIRIPDEYAKDVKKEGDGGFTFQTNIPADWIDFYTKEKEYKPLSEYDPKLSYDFDEPD